MRETKGSRVRVFISNIVFFYYFEYCLKDGNVLKSHPFTDDKGEICPKSSSPPFCIFDFQLKLVQKEEMNSNSFMSEKSDFDMNLSVKNQDTSSNCHNHRELASVERKLLPRR